MSTKTKQIARLLYYGLNFDTAVHYLSMCVSNKDLIWKQSSDNKNVSYVYCQEGLYLIRIKIKRYIPVFMFVESTDSESAMAGIASLLEIGEAK